MSKRGLVSGILDIGSAASKAAKNIRASKSNVTEFATPLKTIKKKDKETGKYGGLSMGKLGLMGLLDLMNKRKSC